MKIAKFTFPLQPYHISRPRSSKRISYVVLLNVRQHLDLLNLTKDQFNKSDIT